jgi:hypothetical protein
MCCWIRCGRPRCGPRWTRRLPTGSGNASSTAPTRSRRMFVRRSRSTHRSSHGWPRCSWPPPRPARCTIFHSGPLHRGTRCRGGRVGESVYGRPGPAFRDHRTRHPNAHLLHTKDGEPVLLDGEEIDREPTARLASPAQRTALAFRDRHCTYPGCSRPPTWSLHAHHKTSYRDGGATTVKNLSFCAPSTTPSPTIPRRVARGRWLSAAHNIPRGRVLPSPGRRSPTRVLPGVQPAKTKPAP